MAYSKSLGCVYGSFDYGYVTKPSNHRNLIKLLHSRKSSATWTK